MHEFEPGGEFAFNDRLDMNQHNSKQKEHGFQISGKIVGNDENPEP
jgi:hypothetical protein